jgi:hypothetical protein
MKHHGLKKHESSVLTQLRTEKIGFRAFLYERRAPDALSPRCDCEAIETVTHLVVYCDLLATQRRALDASSPRPLRSNRDLKEALDDPKGARAIVRWVLQLGRLQQFALAERISQEDGDGAAEEQRGRREPAETGN